MKKIMFNDRYGLTEAVLSGRKTQTRRVVSDKLWDKWTEYDDYCNSVSTAGLGEIGVSVAREYYDEKKFFLENAPYKVGEVVAVAQSYKDCTEECIKTTGLEVTTKPHLAKVPGYKNKLFVRADLMPHHIRITNVRVEIIHRTPLHSLSSRNNTLKRMLICHRKPQIATKSLITSSKTASRITTDCISRR